MITDSDPSTDNSQRTGFFVEDNGNGIPEEQRENIFDHGFTTASNGTGLGLSIVKDIVEAHRWNIRLAHGADGGARFEITGIDIGR